MTSLEFRSREVCAVCRCRLRGILVGSFRVNKDSMRATGVSLSYLEPTCPECGHPAQAPGDRWAPTPDSAAKIRAIRERRGWLQ